MTRLLEAIRLKGEGSTYAQVAQALGISAPRAYQLLMPPAVIRARVLDRAGGQCERCHQGGQRLTLHHRSYAVKPSLYNAARNLQALCRRCHGRAHPANLKRMMEAVRRHPFFAARKTHDAWTCPCAGCQFDRGEIRYNGMTRQQWSERYNARAAKREQRALRRADAALLAEQPW